MTPLSSAWVYDGSLAGITGSNPDGCMDVSCECCVMSGRGLCDGPIPRPEESYRLYVCVYLCVCDCACECVCVRMSVCMCGNVCYFVCGVCV